MNKLHKNARGFTHLALVLLLLIVTVIAIVGWKVHDAHSKSAGQASTLNCTTTKRVNVPDKHLSFLVPTCWKLTKGSPNGTSNPGYFIDSSNTTMEENACLSLVGAPCPSSSPAPDVEIAVGVIQVNSKDYNEGLTPINDPEDFVSATYVGQPAECDTPSDNVNVVPSNIPKGIPEGIFGRGCDIIFANNSYDISVELQSANKDVGQVYDLLTSAQFK